MADFNRDLDKICGCCGNIKPKISYYASLSVKDATFPICKECIRNHYKQAVEKTQSKGAGLWSVCMEVGIPLKREVYDTVMLQLSQTDSAGRKPDMFNLYYTTLKTMGVVFSGNYESDMQLSDFIEVGVQLSEEDILREQNKINCRSKWDKVWGKNYTDDQCEQLDNYFENYTQEILEMDTAMVLRYRDLSKAELRKFEGDDSKEVTEEILKLMKLLKIDNFQENKQSETEKFIDRYAWRIENTKPAECEDLEKYKDYAQNESMWRDILRTIRNAVSGSREYPDLEKDGK